MSNKPQPNPEPSGDLDLYCMKATVAEISDQIGEDQKLRVLASLRRKNPANFFGTPKPELDAAWQRAIEFVAKVFDLPPEGYD